MTQGFATLAVVLGVMGTGALALEPSYDCAKAQGEVEEAICQSDALAELDLELTRLYRLAADDADLGADRLAELKATQRGWIKGRNDCWKSDLAVPVCISNEYAHRIHDLREGYARSRSADDQGVSLGPLALKCEGIDAGISVVYVNTNAAMVSLKWLDRSVVLPRVPSGSGAKYETDDLANGPSTLWSQGDTAQFTPPGGAQTACVFDEIG